MMRFHDFNDHDYDTIHPDDELFFGKYRGQTWEEVHKSDPGYLMWLKGNCDGANDPQSIRDVISELFTVDTGTLMLDQKQSSDDIVDTLTSEGDGNRCYRLQGGAGYGKSFVVTDVAQRFSKLGFVPFGVANSYVATQVLKESLDKVGSGSATIASAFGLEPDKSSFQESYGPSSDTHAKLAQLLTSQSLLIIDEYSMTSDTIVNLVYGTMNQHGNESKLLVVGDEAQLPSPEQDTICRFNDIYPFSELTIPKRFAPDSPLHVLEKAVRADPYNLATHLEAGDPSQITRHNCLNSLYQKLIDDNEDSPDTHGLMLFYKRADVAAANKTIRSAVYGDASEEIVAGERLRVMRTTFVPRNWLADTTKKDGGHWESDRFYSGTFINVEEVEEDVVTVGFQCEGLPDNILQPQSVICLNMITYDGPSDGVGGGSTPLIFSKSEHMADPSTFGGKEFNQALQTVKQYCVDNQDAINGVWKLYHWFRSQFVQISYAYATTVHRCQGASVDRIYLRPGDVLQGPDYIARRLAYVAATRAKSQVHFTL